MNITTSTPNHIKVKMRKVKTIPACIKAELLKGCINQGAYMQFHQDVRMYGLWEALLYAEGYECPNGDFKEGTVHNAMDAYFKTKAVAKILKAALV
jgi:hypothetical protein